MQGLVKLTYKKPCPNVLYLKGIHCFDFWFLQANLRMNILYFTTHQCTGNHKIQVRAWDVTGFHWPSPPPVSHSSYVKENSTASNQNPEEGKAWQQTIEGSIKNQHLVRKYL